MEQPALQLMQRRIEKLERRLRFFYLFAFVVVIALVTTAVTIKPGSHQGDDNIIRTRGLVIEDEKGRDRIVMGAPAPDPAGYGKRVSPSSGIMINDENGYERFGVGLDANGNMIMGFDAPYDKGDNRNPERINIVADAEGGAMIRFLDKKTNVVSFLRLDENDDFCLEFIDRKTGKTMRKQLRYDGEKTLEWK